MLAAAEHDTWTYTANFSVCKQNGMPTMLMNITTVANTYAMKSAQPAVRTQRTRLIVKTGSLLDQTIRRWMLYQTLLTVGAMSELGRTNKDHLKGAARQCDSRIAGGTPRTVVFAREPPVGRWHVGGNCKKSVFLHNGNCGDSLKQGRC